MKRTPRPDTEYRAVFDATSDGLVINDPDTGVVLDANDAFCRMHGYDHMVGLHPTTFIHPTSHHLLQEYVNTARAGGEFRRRAQDVRKDGTVFDVEVYGRAFTYHGKPALLSVVHDVSEQVQAFQLLEERVAERTREIERRRVVAEGMRELVAVVNSQRSLDDILAYLVSQASRLLESPASAIYLPETKADQTLLAVRAYHGLDADYASVNIPSGRAGTGLAFELCRPVAVCNVQSAMPADDEVGGHLELDHRASHIRIVRMPRNERVPWGGTPVSGYRAGLAVPLTAREVTLGVLTLYFLEPREFSDEDVGLATSFAAQAALAIENARLSAHAGQQLRELETLYRADDQMRRSVQLEEVLQALVVVAAEMLHADKTSVLVWDEPRQRLAVRAAHGFHPDTIPAMSFVPGEGISTRVANSGEPIAVEDVANDPRIADHIRAINEREGIRSLVSVPIKLGDVVFGVFNVHSAQPRVFDADEQRRLLGLANRAALAIENARLFAQSERRRREMEALYRADEMLHRSLQLQDVLTALVVVVTDILGADKSSVLVWDERHERLVIGAARGYSVETIANLMFLPGQGIAGRVAVTGKPLFVEDARHDERTDPRIDAITAPEQMLSYVCVPILVKDEVWGVFSVNYREPRSFGEEDLRPLEGLAQRAAVAVQNAQLYERAQQVAVLEERQRLARELHDAVTQTLFSASLIAEVLPRLWDRDPTQVRPRLDELRRLSRGALAEMRTLLLELRPSALAEANLSDLLRQLVEATTSRGAVLVELNLVGEPRSLPADVNVGLYRLAQEALNNTCKHAEARHAWVEFTYGPGSAELEVRDDGNGFDTDPALVPAGHFGLRIMRERADALGATLRVESRVGGGTIVHVAWHDSAVAAR